MAEKTKSPAANMFNEQQEGWLGEAFADFMEHSFPVVHDPVETAYLKKIGDKVVASLPPTKINFRYYVLDSGEVNGLSIAGGRIYLTRKLIASAKSEDEIAGVLGHEIGHIITHQSALETSDMFRKMLHVTSVGDKDDIYRKFHQLLDAEEKQGVGMHSDEDKDQGVADYVGLVGMASAGYHPLSYAEFWNRSFFVNNKTGNTLTDFFGATKPSEKRLRGMKQMIATLPPGCGATGPQAPADFVAWREAVTANRHTRAAEKPTDKSSLIALSPALRMDLQRVRFSPDAKMLLAQDESSIAIFNRDTGKLQFRFDADGAKPAQWSPDSKRIVFHTPSLHVEEWDVAQQKMLSVHEMVVKPDCVQTFLAADGKTLACIELAVSEFDGSIQFHYDLFDVATNQLVFQKKSFFITNFLNVINWIGRAFDKGYNEPIAYAVSQDGRYMVTGAGASKLAVDLFARTEVKLASDFKYQNTTLMAFQGNGIVGVDIENPKKTGVFSFPEGKRLASVPYGAPRIEGISKGNYIAGDGLKEGEVLLLDMMAGKILLRSQTRNFDVSDRIFAGEHNNGDVMVGSFEADKPTSLLFSLKMPLSPLGSTRVIRISDDGRYLAVSGRSRGAVWNLKTGERLYFTYGFTAAAFTKDAVYLDMPKRDKVERGLFRAALEKRELKKVDVKLNDDLFVQSGHLMQWTNDKDRYTLAVQEIDTGKASWKRTFDKGKPASTYNYADGNLVFTWNANSSAGKAEAQRVPAIWAGVSRLRDKSTGLIIEVLSASTGELLKSAVLQKPPVYSGASGLDQVRDTVLMDTADNRVFMFSATNGELFKQMFGAVVGVSAEAGMFCVRNRSDEIQVYDMSGNEVTHLETGSPVRFARFDASGKHLMLLGADQNVRMVDLGKTVAVAADKKQ